MTGASRSANDTSVVSPPKPTLTPGSGSPVSADVIVPATRPFAAAGAGGMWKSSTGLTSLESATPAK